MERFALGKSRLGMRWLVANYDFLTNCLAVGGLCGPESGRLWKTRGGSVVGRAVLQATCVCSMCTGMESGHVCWQDAGR